MPLKRTDGPINCSLNGLHNNNTRKTDKNVHIIDISDEENECPKAKKRKTTNNLPNSDSIEDTIVVSDSDSDEINVTNKLIMKLSSQALNIGSIHCLKTKKKVHTINISDDEDQYKAKKRKTADLIKEIINISESDDDTVNNELVLPERSEIENVICYGSSPKSKSTSNNKKCHNFCNNLKASQEFSEKLYLDFLESSEFERNFTIAGEPKEVTFKIDLPENVLSENKPIIKTFSDSMKSKLAYFFGTFTKSKDASFDEHFLDDDKEN